MKVDCVYEVLFVAEYRLHGADAIAIGTGDFSLTSASQAKEENKMRFDLKLPEGHYCRVW
jgi:hypothetical protein